MNVRDEDSKQPISQLTEFNLYDMFKLNLINRTTNL